MKNLKLRNKLFAMAIITGLIPILLIGVITGVQANKSFGAQIFKTNTVFSTLTMEKLVSYFNERSCDGRVISEARMVQDFVVTYDNPESTEEQKIQAYNNAQTYLNLTINEYGYTNIYVTDKQGKIIFAAKDKSILENADISAMDHMDGSLSGKQTWSRLRYSEGLGTNIMTVSTPVNDGTMASKTLGTVNIMLDQDTLNSMVHKGIDEIGQSGDAYLIRPDGTLLTDTRLGDYKSGAALNKSINTKAVEILAPEIRSGNTNFAHIGEYVDYIGNDVYGSLGVLKIGDYYVGLVIEVDEVEAFVHVNSLMRLIVIIVGLTFVVSIVLVYLIAQSISKPIQVGIGHIIEIANYDITKNVSDSLTSRKDEVGDLARAIQAIETNLRDMMKQIGLNSEQVASASEELTATAQQSSTAVEEVAQTINEIATGAVAQAENTNTGADRLMELGDLIDQDKHHLDELVEDTDKVSALVKEGLVILRELSEKTASNSEASKGVFESIIKTNESSTKISEASNLITSIAEQTNLLALNAAIEAARAGEHGKGFAVVADEIRKLAEQSTNSTKIIDDMVETLREDASKAVEIMEETKRVVEEQQESVRMTEDKYNEISSAMARAEEAVHILNKAGILMDEKKNQVQDTMRNLSAVAEENASGTQQASASTEEQSAAVEQIANASEDLSQLAVELQNLIAKFKVNA